MRTFVRIGETGNLRFGRKLPVSPRTPCGVRSPLHKGGFSHKLRERAKVGVGVRSSAVTKLPQNADASNVWGRNQYTIAVDLFAKQTGKLPLVKAELAAEHQIQIMSAGNHLAKLAG